MLDNTNTNLNLNATTSPNSTAQQTPSQREPENGIKNSLHFIKAIENYDVEELNNILENDTVSKVTINSGLIKALQNYRSNTDSIDIIDSLLNHGADPNYIGHYKSGNQQISNQDKVTILMYACLRGDLQLVHTILKHNPNVNLRDSSNRNALFYAINADKGDNADIVFALINAGINVNEAEKEANSYVSGNSPLTLATQKNMRNTVRTLLDHGANPDWMVAKDGNTALHYAVKNCNMEIINKLISKNANLRIINKENVTALSLAIKLSHTDIYKLLVEEHNKIVNKEKEVANDLIHEEDSVSNISTSSKKKKNTTGNVEVANAVNVANVTPHSDKNPNIDINYMLNTEPPTSGTENRNIINSNTIPINTNQNTTSTSNSSPTNLNKKTNPKMELLTKIKDYKQTSTTPRYQHKPCSYSSSSNHKISLGVGAAGSPSSSNHNPYNSKNLLSHNSGLEIPFEFIRKGDTNTQNQMNQNLFSSYIRIQSTPTLYLDFSDKNKEDTAILSYQLNELKNELTDKNKRIKMLEENYHLITEENTRLKKELSGNSELLLNKDKNINDLIIQFKLKEEQMQAKNLDLQSKLDNSMVHQKEITEKYEKMEKDLYDMNYKNSLDLMNKQKLKDQIMRPDFYLEKKFSTSKYDDKYIIKCLQKDILDFQDYTKDLIKKNKLVLDELLRLVQTAVNESIPDYEIKLYGSHATNLCLPWSDLDMVLVNKRTQYSSNYGALQTLYLNLYDKPWKKSIKLIDTAVIPIIKITASDEFNSMQMDISLQDGKHYGLKCVELVKSFMNEYEALEPLIFALKNLLKNANLNDPYTGGLSSYGLILMVVSYLQSQLESNKPIKIADGNIGRLFLEFLCYYGLIFDHTKYVIYTYAPADLNYVDKDNNNFFFNMQSGHELIIVDPLNKSNNVARSTFQFVNIKMAFMIGFVVSREECECGCHFNNSGEDSIINNTDHCILKRIFNSVKRFNANANNQ